MSLKNKIIAVLTTLGITSGFTFIGLDQACVFDAEVLKVENEKLCFEKQADYLVFKNRLIGLYKTQGVIFLWGEEGAELLAVINYEIEKKPGKIVTVGNVNKNNLVDAIINQIN